MKTKISRFGRSSVSVILAVMMLLSTMLIGTVSTVMLLLVVFLKFILHLVKNGKRVMLILG